MNWRVGDVLILDNMRFAHGRAPFTGRRRLHVAMADSHDTPRRTPLWD
jgi:alpha-ketoglutarate-dependent taurine dioxygenase